MIRQYEQGADLASAEESREVVCTLFEGAYAIGTAALVNSLVASGYSGKLFVGFRGVLQGWAADVKRRSGYVCGPAGQIVINRDSPDEP